MTERRQLVRRFALTPAIAIVFMGLLLPGLLMLGYSFLHYVPNRVTDFTLTTENYRRLFSDLFYLKALISTFQIGAVVTVLSLLLGFPLAMFLARTTSRFKSFFTYLVLLPMMVGVVVRAYGWIAILGREGLINSALRSLGITDAPIGMLYSFGAVVLGLVEVSIPFIVLPILASLEKIDPHVEEAARSLGATPAQTFFRVTLPLSLPGLISGSLLVFSLSITAYVLPELLGGPRIKLIAALAYESMMAAFNWPFGSAIGIFMAVISTLVVYLYLRSITSRQEQA